MRKPGQVRHRVMVVVGLLTFVGGLALPSALPLALAGLAIGFLGIALMHP